MQQAPEFSDFLQNLFIILTLKYAKLKKKKCIYGFIFYGHSTCLLEGDEFQIHSPGHFLCCTKNSYFHFI